MNPLLQVNVCIKCFWFICETVFRNITIIRI